MLKLQSHWKSVIIFLVFTLTQKFLYQYKNQLKSLLLFCVCDIDIGEFLYFMDSFSQDQRQRLTS